MRGNRIQVLIVLIYAVLVAAFIVSFDILLSSFNINGVSFYNVLFYLVLFVVQLGISFSYRNNRHFGFITYSKSLSFSLNLGILISLVVGIQRVIIMKYSSLIDRVNIVNEYENNIANNMAVISDELLSSKIQVIEATMEPLPSGIFFFIFYFLIYSIFSFLIAFIVQKENLEIA